MKGAASKTIGWPERPLGDVLQRIESGVSPKSLDRPTVNGELGVLKVSAVTWGEFRPGENKALPVGFAADGCPRVQRGDLLLSRANTAELLASPVVVKQDYPNLLLSDKTLRLVPKAENADSLYLYYALRTAPCRRYFAAHATGTSGSMRNVSQETIRACPIPLPPLPEQRRIAAILDQADGVRRKRQAALALTDQFLRSTFLEMFGDPVRNPKGWEVVPFHSLLEDIESGWSPVCDDAPAGDDEWGVLKLGGVTRCVYDDGDNKRLPAGVAPRPELEIRAGDLLMSRKNTYDLVAACAYVATTRPKLMLPDLVFRFRFRQDAPVLPEYLWGLFTHGGKRKQIQRLASGTAGSMPNISKARLKTLGIELPPITRQRRFADCMSLVRQLKRRETSAAILHNSLFDSLVHRAFCGEL